MAIESKDTREPQFLKPRDLVCRTVEQDSKLADLVHEAEPQRWKCMVVFLCFYGFMTQIRPGESFITPLLLGSDKNFTREEVTNEITPVLSYSYLAVLVPIFLLTDYLRYTPVLILQSLSHISIWLLLIFGTDILAMQFMEFFYGITMAARVAYSSYVFSLVTPSHYQRVAGYSRSSVLMGVFTSSVIGQLCVTLAGVSFMTLNYISLGFVSLGLILSFFLQRPKRSLFFNRNCMPAGSGLSPLELNKMNPAPRMKPASRLNKLVVMASWKDSVLVLMLKELQNIVKLPQLRLWSLWWIFNSAGYYLMLYYVQILWNDIYPTTDNRKVYNGGVDAASTLLGAITSFAAGYLKIRWTLWSELVIGLFTAFQAALLFLMNTTGNIWVCYIAYILFRGSYQFLVPIAIFQIAASLSKELCALVFGINTFFATVLKTIITIIIADKRGLALSVHPQFYVYFAYFTLLAAVYLVASIFVIVRDKRQRLRQDKPADPVEPASELCNLTSGRLDCSKA
ncbi:folate transporter 1 [Rhinatrema bivittatum]|uniref:folate transporter 1 n=1 Tax=Rhinatrema bivittatum TaxID=194408 RepID=UPI001128A8A0|nr:folate transporter 1 [Rhinatrema bivittatum]XP_029462601.1 folate transporter 1 [Rhinatrema bivittatum]XP_029462602.1 folate transporter 1 [Rhinatrema bivittatum]XP_029462603.1 folate transporter 1 [Rhinatrema bivittatum]XP_029462604.1 folate transporter 1 [Rhinatrema bivittatum]